MTHRPVIPPGDVLGTGLEIERSAQVSRDVEQDDGTVYRAPAKRWAKALAVLFAIGAVSGPSSASSSASRGRG